MDFNKFEWILINFGIETRFPQVEGVKSEAGEARRGPNKSQLEPKIGQNLQSKKYIYLEPMDIEPLIAIWSIMNALSFPFQPDQSRVVCHPFRRL